MRETWVDFRGLSWPVVASARRLNFRYPAHAALRAHVFHRDGFRCCRCPAKAIDVPTDYDGRFVLQTDTFVLGGQWRDMLVLDHVLTLRAGGRSVIGNLQALCETCNRKKIPADVLATRLEKGGAYA